MAVLACAAMETLAAIAVLALLAAPASSAPAPAPRPAPGPSPPPGAARITVETIAVDRRGTWSVGTDQADIFSGASGVLKRNATLVGRDGKEPAREMIDLGVRILPTLQPGGGCALRLESEARAVVAGAPPGTRPPPPAHSTAAIVLGPDEDRLVEVYASVVTAGRLALKVRCAAASFGAAGGAGEAPRGAGGGSTTRRAAASAADLEFVDFVLSVSRADEEKPVELLKANRLRTSLGHEASNLFSFQLPLPDDARGSRRYRREKLEVTLTPAVVSAGRLQVELQIHGEVATVSAAEPTVAHPVDRAETLVLASGGTHRLELEVPSSGAREGWGKVRYEIQITGRFE